jgi:AraC-like DNA-binding protein
MYHQEFPPHENLKPYIRCYILISLNSGDFLFPADGCPGLIVNLGDPFLLGFEKGRLTQFVGCRLFGSSKRHLISKHINGQTYLVAVKFHPGQLPRFFNVPASELTDQSVSLQTLWGKSAKEMEHKFYEAENISKILWLLDNTLINFLSNQNSYDDRILVALNTIWRLKGQVFIEELALKLNLSRRHLERRFLDYVGLRPKHMCRIARFLNTFFSAKIIQSRSWVDLAIASGYSDQAHLIRECKYFTDLSPLSYLKCRSSLEHTVTGTIDTMSHFFNTI